MARWFDVFPWLVWLFAALVTGTLTVLGLFCWWLKHPVEDEEPPTAGSPGEAP